jgi:putative hydrolase
MSEPGSFPDPFGGMFGDLAKMLGSIGGGGPVNWEMARQLAQWVATEGQTEANVDPVERMKLEDLLRVADLHVGQATGLDTNPSGRLLTVVPVTRTEWARRTLDDEKPLLEALGAALAVAGNPVDGTEPDPTTQLLGGLPQLLGPFMMAAMAGSMVGHLAQRSLGRYDLPLPRPAGDELVLVPANVDGFAGEWSLPPDDVRLWVLLDELVHHAVLGRAHVRARLESLLVDHAQSFDTDPTALETKLGEVDLSDPTSFERLMGDPELVLGAVQSDAQRDLVPRLRALTAVVSGYTDHVMDALARKLIGSYGQLSEALRRRRVEDATGTRYAGRLFGLDLSQDAYDAGRAFVEGVVERAGEDALARLWESERTLPTPAELGAPGLWLARIELPELEE